MSKRMNYIVTQQILQDSPEIFALLPRIQDFLPRQCFLELGGRGAGFSENILVRLGLDELQGLADEMLVQVVHYTGD